jgi:hypothetical protein
VANLARVVSNNPLMTFSAIHGCLNESEISVKLATYACVEITYSLE